MSRDTHTPGPWFWFGAQLKTRADMGRTPVWNGWCVPLDHDSQWGNAEANKDIISKSPAIPYMIEALQAVLTEVLSEEFNLSDQTLDQIQDALDRATA